MADLQQLLKNLTENEKEQLAMLLAQSKNNKTNDDLLLKLPNNHHCPFCKSNKVRKNGKQQMFCRECKKYYSLKTNTIFFKTKKSLTLWKQYIDLMIEGRSLRYIAEKLDINLTTAFYWRHKILDILKQNNNNNDKPNGIIEADETYFEFSEKGSRKLNRKPHKRGHNKNDMLSVNKPKHKRGLSNDKVCVICAIDRNNKIFNTPNGFGKVSKKKIGILQDNLQQNSILITDGDRSYNALNGFKLKQYKFGYSTDKLYNMAHINQYHSNLKGLIIHKFKGVATKFLDNYVDYCKFIKEHVNIFSFMLNHNGLCFVNDVKSKTICF